MRSPPASTVGRYFLLRNSSRGGRCAFSLLQGLRPTLPSLTPTIANFLQTLIWYFYLYLHL